MREASRGVIVFLSGEPVSTSMDSPLGATKRVD